MIAIETSVNVRLGRSSDLSVRAIVEAESENVGGFNAVTITGAYVLSGDCDGEAITDAQKHILGNWIVKTQPDAVCEAVVAF